MIYYTIMQSPLDLNAVGSSINCPEGYGSYGDEVWQPEKAAELDEYLKLMGPVDAESDDDDDD